MRAPWLEHPAGSCGTTGSLNGYMQNSLKPCCRKTTLAPDCVAGHSGVGHTAYYLMPKPRLSMVQYENVARTYAALMPCMLFGAR